MNTHTHTHAQVLEFIRTTMIYNAGIVDPLDLSAMFLHSPCHLPNNSSQSPSLFSSFSFYSPLPHTAPPTSFNRPCPSAAAHREARELRAGACGSSAAPGPPSGRHTRARFGALPAARSGPDPGVRRAAGCQPRERTVGGAPCAAALLRVPRDERTLSFTWQLAPWGCRSRLQH